MCVLVTGSQLLCCSQQFPGQKVMLVAQEERIDLTAGLPAKEKAIGRLPLASIRFPLLAPNSRFPDNFACCGNRKCRVSGGPALEPRPLQFNF